jgi:hypothetical protein
MDDNERLLFDIEAQTALIKQLEASYPVLASSDAFDKVAEMEWRTAFNLHHTKVRDAFWCRRMLIAERNGDLGEMHAAAQVY